VEIRNAYTTLAEHQRKRLPKMCILMGEKRNAYRIQLEKSEGKRLLGSPRRRLVDNIKMDLRAIGPGGMDWIDRAQNTVQWRDLAHFGVP
jgi:hypothetical protein